MRLTCQRAADADDRRPVRWRASASRLTRRAQDRLGSAAAYVEHDADDAWAWLQAHGLIDGQRALLFPTGA